MLQSLRRLYAKLHLKVNESKTAVGPVFGRKFLGYCFRRWSNNTVKIAVAPKAIATFKQRIKEITRRSGGRSLTQVAEQLRLYLPGWKSYFHLAQTPKTFKDFDSWIRHRLRAVQLKHWRRGRTVYREVRKSGCVTRGGRSGGRGRQSLVASQPVAPQQGSHGVLLRQLGRAPALMTSTTRTARCGPACRVVWEGTVP